MPATITFFPVENGDMTLITLEGGQTILIDCNIRAKADENNDDTPDVAKQLRDRLKRDSEDRLYVDAMLMSHPDQDHVTGLRNHFHLGSIDTWSKDDDKIVIREMWSSPIVFRRASSQHTLCKDAKAWNTEAKRRVELYRKDKSSSKAGDRILLMGEDQNGKTDDILSIVVKVEQEFSKCNRKDNNDFTARLLGPLPAENDDDATTLSKNNSSVVVRFSLHVGASDKCRFLTGGDAGVEIWKRLWNKHSRKNTDWLEYDLLLSPHHCSWRSLSFDRWSELGEKVKVCKEAKNALSQTRKGALVIASSKAVKKDDDNPPHERAKREYVKIVDGDDGRFLCTTEVWDNDNSPIEFEIKKTGIVRKVLSISAVTSSGLGVGGVASQARGHG
jgi:hypothetical protein